ncbi:hypothetical protein E3C22_08510 [Jiella endophytica]|uniref:Uncharacterized protein n=1 Tax=Jiella endophytica TaxID=2558362 RepID=A0A4Y8RRR0_9HYPH|nr:tetratricopeptide repeat protein [Jiella endophytica]TFF25387.1 hypothetical protein E3C22_08510 [Jiella endophytica]
MSEEFVEVVRDGREARAEGQREEALAACLAAVETCPDDVSARLDVATELRELGRFAEAAAWLEPLVTADRPRPGARRQLAQIARAKGDHRCAGEMFEALALDMPDNVVAHIEAARSFLEIGDSAAFDRNLAAVLAIDPANDQAALLKARSLERAGEHLAALSLLEAELTRSEADGAEPNVETASSLIGLALRTGQIDRAEELLRSVRFSGPQQKARAAFLRSHLLRYRNRFLAAEAELRDAVRLAPRAVSYRLHLAEVRIVLGDLAAAEDDLAVAAEILSVNRGSSQSVMQDAHLRGFLALVARGPRASDRLLALLKGDGADRATGLTALVSRFPGHVPTSLALLRELRASGGLASHAPGPNAQIPREIFQFWDMAKPPADVAALMATWPATSPDHRYRCFDDESARAFLADGRNRDALDAFDSAAHPAMRADLFRLAYAFRRGGVYADADEASHMPLADIIPARGRLLLIIEETTGVLWNGFFAAEPRHPVIGRALSLACRRVLSREEGNVWSLTGPPILATAVTQLLAEQPEIAGGVSLHAKSATRHWLSTGHDCAYKRDESNWKNATRPDDVYRAPPR